MADHGSALLPVVPLKRCVWTSVVFLVSELPSVLEKAGQQLVGGVSGQGTPRLVDEAGEESEVCLGKAGGRGEGRAPTAVTEASLRQQRWCRSSEPHALRTWGALPQRAEARAPTPLNGSAQEGLVQGGCS